MAKGETGRPRLIGSPEEFERLADAYFDECDETKTPYTITGLALALGFADKCTVYDYQKYEGFSHPVKRARLRVENSYELELYGSKPTGSIFALKNFDWTDRRQHEHSGPDGGPISVIERRIVDPKDTGEA